MLVISVELGADLVESAITDLGEVVSSQNQAEIKEKAYAAWKKLGEVRRLLRDPTVPGRLMAQNLQAMERGAQPSEAELWPSTGGVDFLPDPEGIARILEEEEARDAAS